jgi:hypothetical protein
MKFQLFYLPEILEPELWIINLNPSMAHPRPFYLPPKVYTNIVNNMAKCGENW